MATKLRKFKCYRKVVRAYTRKSKYKNKAYVKAVPNSRIVRYHMGDVGKKFEYEINLISKDRMQVRDNALESARQVSNRRLENALGRQGYHFQIMVYPHHALRENKMLVGAGADRMQTGMQKSFGKVIGIAARLKKGQPLFKVHVDKEGLDAAKNAMRGAIHRLPMKCRIEITEVKNDKV